MAVYDNILIISYFTYQRKIKKNVRTSALMVATKDYSHLRAGWPCG